MTERRGWPILGRTDVVATILDALNSSPRRPQLLVGPAGIGKSILLELLAEEQRSLRPLAAIGLAELSGVPLGAFSSVIAELALPTVPEQAVPALVAQLSSRTEPALLTVDDAPRLDDVSAGVVYNAIRAFAVPALLTARLGEELPENLARLVDEGRMDLHTIEGLSVAEVDDLLEHRFEQRVRYGDVQRLLDRTAGNPLYLRSVVERAEADGGVRSHVDGVLEIEDGSTAPTLLASLSQRLDELQPTLRRMLHIVALTQPVAPEVVVSDPQVRGVIDQLIVGGFVVEQRRTLRISHPLLAEVLERDDDLREVRSQAAALLMRTGSDQDRFAAVQLYLAAETPLGQAELAWAAAYALASGDAGGAIRLARRALERGPLFGAYLTIGTAEAMSRNLDQADQAFAQAAAVAATVDEKVLLAGRRGEHLAFRRGDAAAAIAQAEEILAGLPPEAGRGLDADIRLWRIQTGDVSADAGGADSDHLDPHLAARTAAMTVLAESLSGTASPDSAAAERLERDAEQLGVLDPTAAAMLGFNRYIHHLTLGEGAAAHELVTQRRLAAGPDIGLWTFIAAEHATYLGQVHEAEDLIEVALDQLEWRDELGAVLVGRELRAMIAAQVGDTETATRIRAEQGTYPSMLPTTGQIIAECRAWLSWRAGDGESAAQLVRDAAREARELGFRFISALGLAFSIRLGDVEHAAAELEEICTEVSPDFVWYTALRDLAVALRDQQPGAVLAPASRVAEASLVPTALDAIAQATRMNPGGEVRRKLERLASTLRHRVDGPLLQEIDHPALTARELEVSRRAAARERSREIAEALDISISTVNNQLNSSYRKLGVGSRDELRQALQEINEFP